MKIGEENVNYKHGLRYTKEYRIWCHIKWRCYNEKCDRYKDYGFRGIKLQESWIENVVDFINYIKSLPNYGIEGYTLDRIDNDGDYEVGNLRWADKTTQSLNQRLKKNNKSGYKDICVTKNGKYRARVRRNRETLLDKTFNTLEEAIYERNRVDRLWQRK